MIVLDSESLSDAERDAVRHGAAFTVCEQPVISIEGSGAVDCLQGVLTNDVTAGPGSAFLYGAVLTPKGMIECDVWTVREARDRLVVYPAPEGVEALTTVFQKFFPPRLAKTTDLSDTRSVIRLLGPKAHAVARDAGIAVPEPGHARRVDTGIAMLAARPPLDAPFGLQLDVAGDVNDELQQSLLRAGAVGVRPESLDFARILTGWPRLGAEIDDKTLPQDVRFDDLHGVSYTKGCYTGQETVARVHFRGHANKRLVGVHWTDEPDAGIEDIHYDGKIMGRVTTVAWIGQAGYVGMGIVRRGVPDGAPVTACDTPATTVPLPFPQESGALVG